MRTDNEQFENQGFRDIEFDPASSSVNLPEGLSLNDSLVVRDGSGLLITAKDGTAYSLNGFFSHDQLPDLQDSHGSFISAQSLDDMGDVDAAAQVAQANIPGIPGLEIAQMAANPAKGLGEPIGKVEEIDGDVSVVRADGTTDILNIGDLVYQGDKIETPEDSGIGITLADTSSFALGENSEMVLDELVYDPGTQEGKSVLSLVEGTASYVSGQIAKINPDAVSISTPVATIGIRGTKVFLEFAKGEFKALNLLETTLDGETPGEIVVYAPNGTPIGSTNQANMGWSWRGNDSANAQHLNLSPAEVNRITERTLRHQPRSLAEKALEAREMENALKEAADIAAREAEDAQNQLSDAEQAAQAKQEAAELAKQEADALEQQALSEEQQLAQLQQQLEALIQSGASASEIAQLEQALGKLKLDVSALLSTLEQAKQAALEAEGIALAARQLLLDAREEAALATQAAKTAMEAAREAHDIAQNAYLRATQYLGFKTNTDTDPIQTAKGNKGDNGNTEITVTNGEDEKDKSGDGDGDLGGSGDSTLPGSGGEDDLVKKDETPTPTTNTNEPATTTPVEVSGKAVDGYLSGATVFIDANKNGILDAGEVSTTTDAKGNYSLSGSISGNDYVITMIGGTDIATGKAFYGVLQAPAGSKVVTPLTTLLAKGVSEADLKAAFGIDSSINLTEIDPVAGASNSAIAKVAAIGVQIQNTILQASSAIEGASSSNLDNGATGGAVFDALASAIKNANGSTFNISDASKIQSVIEGAAGNLLSGTDLTKAQAAAANTSQMISSSNGIIDGYITNGGSGDNLLASLAQVAVVANDAATALETAVKAGDDLNALQTQYSSSSLSSKIEQAQIGDTNGDGSTNTVNAAPVISANLSLSTNEDSAITVSKAQLLTNATDAETAKADLTISELKVTNATIIDNQDGTWTITPTQDSTAAIALTYKVSDGLKSTDATANITVNAQNDAPVASNATASANEGDATITGSLSATDVDDNTIYFTSNSRVAGFTLNENGTYSFNSADAAYNSLAKGQTQTITINFTAYDSHEASDSGTLTITLTGTNDAPTVSSAVSFGNGDEQALYLEDTAFTLSKSQLLTNASDVDGDTLDVLNVTVTSGGTVVDNGNGTWTITPTTNSVADIALSYTVSDTKGGTVTQTATIDIDPVNDAPVVSNIVTLSGFEDTTLSFTASQLLANASDVDGDTLSVINVTASSGQVQTTDGGWSYTPTLNSTANVTFTYTISDGHGGTIQTTAVAGFEAVNDAPTIDANNPITLSGIEDTVLTITPAQLLANASDVEGDNMNVLSLSASVGSVAITQSGWTYTPVANSTETVTFTYTVSDGNGGSVNTSATATFQAVNDAPVVSATPTFSTTSGQDIFISAEQLLAYASDIDTASGSLSVTDVAMVGDSGSITWNGEGWTFASNTTGSVTFSYNVFDGALKTATSATVTVQEPQQANNLAPTIGDPITLSGVEDGGEAGYITITPAQLLAGAADDQDQINDTISVTNLAIQSGGGTLSFDSASGNWHYVPPANSTSNVVFTYNVTDGTAQSAQQTATLSLSAVNDAPVVSNVVTFSGTEDTVLSITKAQLLANASDVDGDTLNIENLSASSGTLVATDLGWNFTPVANSTAQVTFSYTITDGNGGSVPSSAVASFAPVNDTPTNSASVTMTAVEDTAITITKTQLLANASDVEGDSLQVKNLSISSGGGNLSYNQNDTWTYTPAANYTGSVVFTYDISDGAATLQNVQAVATYTADNITDGTTGNDTLSGTSGDDTISALSGNDVITGGAGNDYINGGEGNDTAVFSGNWSDYTFTPDENGDMTVTDNNTADGNDGTDTLISIENYQFADRTFTGIPGEITGTSGNDFIVGSHGVDIVNGGAGNDWIWTYGGSDIIYGGEGDDVIWTRNGTNVIQGNEGNDRIWSGNGDDTIQGNDGNDTIWSGGGADTVQGGAGADIIRTEDGNDVIILSQGDVTLNGGNGTDTLRLINGDGLDFGSSDTNFVSLEAIDLLTDTASNVLTLGANDINNMNGDKTVMISGNNSDSVTFSDSGWQAGATADGYTTYNHAQTGTSASISQDIQVHLP